MNCDICGNKNDTVGICYDDILRCRNCRQRAKYGRTMSDDTELWLDEQHGPSLFDLAPVAAEESGQAELNVTVVNNVSGWQARRVLGDE